MKIFKFFILSVCFLATINSIGQKDIFLKINQKLDNELFQFEKLTKNNLNQSFFIKRIDYYISGIALHHDNGIVTRAKNLYVLVNKNEDVNVFLGNYFVDDLDSITFKIGIDSITNHADPAQYAANHPLAPKDPDMHWGWAAGYKFIVIEGQNGPDMIYDFQLHAFGDHLYTHVSIPAKGKSIADKLIVELDANYQNTMNQMNLDKIVIVHGSNKDVIQLMKNFQNNVFQETTDISSADIYDINGILIYPNPGSHGTFNVVLSPEQANGSTLIIKDVMGRVVQKTDHLSMHNTIFIDQPGLYFTEIIKENKIIGVGRIICH